MKLHTWIAHEIGSSANNAFAAAGLNLSSGANGIDSKFAATFSWESDNRLLIVLQGLQNMNNAQLPSIYPLEQGMDSKLPLSARNEEEEYRDASGMNDKGE